MASGRGNKAKGFVRGSGGKATATRRVPRIVNVFPEEVQFSEEVDGDSVPKDAYLFLKRAFDDVKQKLVSTRNHNAKLKEKNSVCENKIKVLEEKLEFFSSVAKENESLKKKIELSFKAFDEKYKESENLRKKLEKVSKEDGNEQSEEQDEEQGEEQNEKQGEEQQDLENKDKSVTQSQTNIIFNVEIETVDSFTQTPEEKNDEQSYIPSSTLTNILESCGLEIVVENRKHYLKLIERDALKKWIENETDGKVIVVFEKTPVIERYVQTVLTNDGKIREQERVEEEYQENKQVVIFLKNKIVDQANSIKLQREHIAEMSEILRNTKAKKVSTASVLVQTEERVHNEQLTNKQIQLIARYNKPVLTALCVLQQKLVLLNKDLEYQKFYSRRLLQTIKTSMDVPKIFVSSVLKKHQEMKSKTNKTQVRTVSRAFISDENLQGHAGFVSPPESYAELPDPHLSLPVQETDKRLRIKIVKRKDSDYDESLDKEAISIASAGSRSSSRESSVSIVPVEDCQTTYNSQVNASSAVMRDLRIQSSTSTSPRVEQSSGQDDGDDIEVIGEDEMGAAGGRGDIKECPICFKLFTSGTSQLEFEKHVTDHFKDYDE